MERISEQNHPGNIPIPQAEKVVSINVIAPNLDDDASLALKRRISEVIKDVPGGQIHFTIHERTQQPSV